MLKKYKILTNPSLTQIIRLGLSTNYRPSSKSSGSLHLAYESYGKSSTKLPLVILHGLFGSKGNWKSMAKALHSNTGNRQVVCIDARNHGDSPHNDDMSYPVMGQDLAEFLAQTKLAPTILMGHSMGGRTAMYSALTWPHLIDGLIVVDISPLGSSPSLNAMPKLFQTLKNVKIERGTKISEARAIADKQMSEDISEASLRQFLLTNLTRDADGTIRWKVNVDALDRNFSEKIAKFPHIKRTAVYNKPTLFIAGALSDYISQEDEAGIKKLFPNSEFVYIQDAGHWVHAEQPIAFMNAVAQFVNKIN